MKVAEAVGKFLEAQGIGHVFGVNGGANLHLIHGVNDVTHIKFIPTAHESGAGFAADAYGRITGIGCAMATSGPGATNLVTAIATSYYDSVPVLYITGNVASFRFGSRFGVRQYGFQETPICDIVRPITKGAWQCLNPEDVIPTLEKAVMTAISGRPGPVLVDIPDDVQRMECTERALYNVMDTELWRPPPRALHVETTAKWFADAHRPIFIWGAGMRPYAAQARALAESLDVPVACTWGAVDLLPHDHYLMLGGFGTHGVRAANLAIQNADLVISLGSRLDTKATGNPEQWVRGGKVVMVDIDSQELDKHKALGRQIDLRVESDAGAFIDALALMPIPNFPDDGLNDWNLDALDWKVAYRSHYDVIDQIAPTAGRTIVSDTGTGIGMVCQAFPFNGSQRLIHAFNMTPMGYAFPAAVGAAFATGERVTCIVGDGGAMMSLSELATIKRWNLPIDVHLLDNQGHAMCRQTERQWFGGRNVSTSIESGLGFPDWPATFAAFGVAAIVHKVPYEGTLIPQARFGQPIEDADPQLPWDEFKAQMIVEPLERR